MPSDITRDSGGERSLNHATEDVNKHFIRKSLVVRELKTFFYFSHYQYVNNPVGTINQSKKGFLWQLHAIKNKLWLLK